jgi:ribulose-phosphate 3-epimerase
VKITISPSILSADFANLESELKTISTADMIHVDVMDNHFVPNLTIGLPVVKRIQEVSTVPLDVHLMIENPDLWAVEYAKLGVSSVTFHAEAARDIASTIKACRLEGSKVGLALKPNTPINDYLEILQDIDMVLLMTVEPGFGGQPLIESVLEKISHCRDYIISKGLTTSIQVDGGITRENVARVARSGADCFVAGSSVFSAADRNGEITILRDLASNL